MKLFLKYWVIKTIFFIPVFSTAQTPDTIRYGAKASEVNDQLKDGYTLAGGWTIQKGDTIVLGSGTMPDHSFTYIYKSPASMLTDAFNKQNLKEKDARTVRVKDIFPYGTKQGGFTIIAKVKVGETINYWIEIDKAYSSNEIIAPNAIPRKPLQNNSTYSAADELKKWKDLLDSGAITKEEYEAQKKKILERQ